MDVNFDIQRHLTDMETRIRTDIRSQGDALVRVQQDSEEARVLLESQNGRIKALEEKAGWLGAGIATAVLSAFGFIWHLLTGGR